MPDIVPHHFGAQVISERQTNNKFAALARAFASSLDVPAMHFDQAANQSEPDTQPTLSLTGRVFDLHEHLEDTGQHIRQDADAAIANRDHYIVALALRAQPDSSSGIGIL